MTPVTITKNSGAQDGKGEENKMLDHTFSKALPPALNKLTFKLNYQGQA
tara:strand:- start:632 stop:778 length:147 start_codon:yes stop_codon:yes gene_type:complete